MIDKKEMKDISDLMYFIKDFKGSNLTIEFLKDRDGKKYWIVKYKC